MNTARWPVQPVETRFSLKDMTYEALKEAITTTNIYADADEPRLDERQLSEDLGVSRTPIREALQRLAREGLVVILPRKGILVSEINPRNQLLVLEARRELERLMARKGAVRQTEEEKAQFLEIADGMEKAARENDDIGFMRLDYALNILIAKAAHNEYASRAVGLLHGMSRRFWYMHYKEAADLPLCASLHAKLARRIAHGDADGAAQASDQLVDYVETFTRATVDPNLLSR